MVLCALIVLPVALAAKPKKPPKKKAPPPLPACPHDATLGKVAYARDGALHLVEFRRCTDKVIVTTGVSGPVKFSPDGKYIGFTGGMVPATGGNVVAGSPLWAPAGHVNATVTKGGGALIGRHRILADGWGAVSAIWTPQGNLLISRSRYPRKPYHQEVWIWFQDTGNLRRVGGPFKGVQTADLAGVSIDGSWAFWWRRSSPDAAGPVPLVSKRLAARSTGPVIAPSVSAPDGVTWCGGRLVVVSGGSIATAPNTLVLASPPLFKAKTLVSDGRAWASPTCSADGQILVNAQPASATPHWGVWTVSLKGTRHGLFSPPTNQSYESPKWAPNGGVFFVRRVASGAGQLMYWVGGQMYGPVATVGSITGSYGHHDWWSEADWHQ